MSITPSFDLKGFQQFMRDEEAENGENGFDLDQFLEFLNQTRVKNIDELFDEEFVFPDFLNHLSHLKKINFEDLDKEQKVQFAKWLIINASHLDEFYKYNDLNEDDQLDFTQIGINLFMSLIHNE